jgi:hypothetical protein
MEKTMFTHNPSNFRFMAALLMAGLFATAAAANTAPSAASMAAGVYQNSTLDFFAPGVLTNATDPESDPLTAVLLVGPQFGTLQFNADGSFNYTPNSGYTGPDGFMFAAFDGSLESAPATMDITVIPVIVTNSPPVASDVACKVLEGTRLDMRAPGLMAYCFDADGDVMTMRLATKAEHGAVDLGVDGSFSYEPHTGYVGADTFEFELSDGNNVAGNWTVNLFILASKPSFSNIGDIKVHDSGSPVSLQWATEISAGWTHATSLAMWFEVTNSSGNGLFEQQPAIDATGVLTFTLIPGAAGDAIVRVVLYDAGIALLNGSAPASDPVIFHITVIAEPDATLGIGSNNGAGEVLSGSETLSVHPLSIEVAPNGSQEEQGSCTAGTGNMPWWLLLAAPAVLVGAIRRKRVAA